MRTVLRRKAFLISSLALAIGASTAVAGGFEKATMWDAKYSALGGAAASSVNNSSAIFYNPAGLAFIESNDISIHASPTVVRANGPANGSDYTKGEKLSVPNGGFTGAYRLSDDFVLGYGVYGAGGAAAKYKGVTTGNRDFIDTSLTGDYSTDIKVVEAGLALAYKINNNWSVGGTYRLTYAYADINIMSKKGPVGVKVNYNDMSGIDSFGMRLGAMYRSDDNRFGWGMNYRSEVDMKAKGDYSGNTGLGKIPPYDYEGKVTAKTALPMQISTGVDYLVSDNWRLFGEATYTNYKKVNKIEFDSDSDVLVPVLNTNWKNQMNYRFAAEYYGLGDWTLRGGYVYTTAVVPEKYAAPTFSTPGAAHTYILGAGTSFLNDTLLFDVAAEYNRAKNKNVKGGGNLAGPSSPAASGRYDTEAFALHATLRYKF